MRINSIQDLKQGYIKDSVRVNLSGGYNRGLWNQDVGAVFLVSEDNTVTTVIPEDDIPENHDRIDEKADHCDNCDALIMDDCDLDNCRWCGTKDYEETVTSLPG